MKSTEIVLRLSSMGDILLTIPTLRAIADKGVEPHIVIHKKWEALAPFLPANTHIYRGTGNLLKTVNKLKLLKPDALYDLQGKAATVAIRALLSPPIVRVYQKRTFTETIMVSTNRYPLRFIDSQPVWKKYLITCGLPYEQPNPLLELKADYLQQTCDFLASQNLVPHKYFVIHPDASYKAKQIPQNIFDKILASSPMPVVVIGEGDNNFDLPEHTINLRNNLALSQLPGILKFSAGVISSDSGPMHMARAVNAPLVALFFQTSPSLGFEPIPADNLLVFSKELDCKPCSLHGQRELCPLNTFECQDFDPLQLSKQIFDFLVNFL